MNILSTIKTYKNISIEKKSAVWFTITNTLQKGVSIITVPIFSRLLTTGEYGVYSVFMAWKDIVAILITLRIAGGVMNKGLIKYCNSRDEFTSAMLGLTTTLFLGSVIVLFFFIEQIQAFMRIPSTALYSMLIYAFTSACYNIWITRQRFEYKYRMFFISTIVIAILNPSIGIVLVLTLKEKALARIISVTLVSLIFGLIVFVSTFVKGKLFYSKEYWIYAFRYNIVLIPHFLAVNILSQADRIMINNMIGSAQAGIYGVAYSASMGINIIKTSINQTILPWTFNALNDKQYEKIYKRTVPLLFGFLFINSLYMLFTPEIVSILAPSAYREAIWLLPIICASVYFTFLYSLFTNIELYFEKNQYIMLASVLASIVNVVTNLIFIPIFGYQAAAFTTLGCYILLSAFHYFVLRRIMKSHEEIQKLYNFKAIITIGVLVLIVTAISVGLNYLSVALRYSIITILSLVLIINKNKIIKLYKEFK